MPRVSCSRSRAASATGSGRRASRSRPPLILSEAGRAGYPVSVGYSVDSLDFKDPGAAAVRQNVRAGAVGGSIVSMHFGHQGTIDALPGVLDDLRARGLATATVGELLA